MAFELPTSYKSDAERLALVPKLQEMAAAGDIHAQVELAWELAEGKIMEADFVRASQLFESAAASGDPDAQLNLARFLYLRRVPEGARIIQKFARNGNIKAQLWQGLRYRSERGRINQLRAAAWFKRAQQQGSVSGALVFDRQRIVLAPLPAKPVLVLLIFGRWFWKLVISSELENWDSETEFNHTFTRLKRR